MQYVPGELAPLRGQWVTSNISNPMTAEERWTRAALHRGGKISTVIVDSRGGFAASMFIHHSARARVDRLVENCTWYAQRNRCTPGDCGRRKALPSSRSCFLVRRLQAATTAVFASAYAPDFAHHIL